MSSLIEHYTGNMKRLSTISILIGLWFAFVLLACNLGGVPPNATLVPRATQTPPPTIGYATLSPEQVPGQTTALPPQSDATLLNLINRVETDRLLTHVDALQGFGTRHINSPYNVPGSGIGAAREYIWDAFADIRAQYPNSGFSAFEDTFTVDFGGVRSNATNIIGFLPGREVGAGVIVVGAHYDTISIDFEDGSAFSPGANDNASGVAAILETARVMAARPQQPRSSIIFAAFSAEEIGREGSVAFINNYLQPNDIDIIAMINLDIIGSSDSEDGAINDRQIRVFSEGPNNSPSRQLARALNLITFVHMPTMETVIQDAVDRPERYSDHMSFSNAGYPAIRFIEMNEEINRHHTPRDTMDDIDPTYMTRSTQTVLAALIAMGDGPRAPRNVVIRDNGNGTRTLVWEPVADAKSYVIALRYPGSTVYNQYFETTENSITSEIFTPDRLEGIAISAKDGDGLLGPLSGEYFVVN
jgi:hypothetical protein